MDTAQIIEKISKVAFFSLSILTFLETLLGIIFLGIANPRWPGAAIFIALLVHVPWSGSLIYVSLLQWRASQNCVSCMLIFHDFLIEYRQTPRSKMLRKHLPKMEAVVEEASAYE